MKPSLVFFGNERIATGLTTDCPILTSLTEAGYPIEAIVVSHQESMSRSRRTLEILDVAKVNNIPVFTPATNSELFEVVKNFGSETAVLVAFGRMVPDTVIRHFKNGIVNIHPSLLPKHRGSIPIESVILSGETTTGVSLMKLVSDMDAGPIIAQSTVELVGNETKQAIANKLVIEGTKLLIEHLPAVTAQTAPERPQNDVEATYDQRIAKDDGQIDWTKPAATIEREIRAYAGWPKSRTRFADIDLTLTAAHVLPGNVTTPPGTLRSNQKHGCLSVACGDATELCIERLIPAGKNEMLAADFLRGYGNRLLPD